MNRFVLDTDTLSEFHRGNSTVIQNVERRDGDLLAITVLTVEEQLSGWYTLLRKSRQPEHVVRVYSQLGQSVVRLAKWPILPYTATAIERVAYFKTLHFNVRHTDLRIAAVAIENDMVLVTRNTKDFVRIPDVRIEDWSI
jgi:tRNA(fMet)-specific endonuclease VapC